MKWPAYKEVYYDVEFQVSLCSVDFMEVPLERALTEHPFAYATGILPFPQGWRFTMEGTPGRDFAETGEYHPTVRITPPGITVDRLALVSHGIHSLVGFLVSRDFEILGNISSGSNRCYRRVVELLEMASLKNPNLVAEFIHHTFQDRALGLFSLLKTGRERGAVPYESKGTRWFLLMDTFAVDGNFLHLDTHQSLGGLEIPRSLLVFWDRSSGLTVFHGQGWSYFPTVGEFLERYHEVFQEGVLYGSSPYSPGALSHLEARAVVRLPSYREIQDLGESRIPHPPRGLPSMGYLLDTRSPLAIPQDIPVILDRGEALSILSRTPGIYYVQDAPPSIKENLWVNYLDEERETWVVLAVPRLKV